MTDSTKDEKEKPIVNTVPAREARAAVEATKETKSVPAIEARPEGYEAHYESAPDAVGFGLTPDEAIEAIPAPKKSKKGADAGGASS
jgi:hypothetical protein